MLGDANNPIRSILDSGTLMPTGATAIAASSADVAAAAAVATLPAVAAVTNYLTGFRIAGTGATAGVGVAVTITGLAAGTLTFVYTAVAGAILANTPLEIVFPKRPPRERRQHGHRCHLSIPWRGRPAQLRARPRLQDLAGNELGPARQSYRRVGTPSSSSLGHSSSPPGCCTGRTHFCHASSSSSTQA